MGQRRVGIPEDPASPAGIVIDAGETKTLDLIAPGGINVNGAPLGAGYAPTGHTHSGAYAPISGSRNYNRVGFVENLAASGAVTLNAALGDTFQFILVGNVTFTFTNPVPGQRVLVQLLQDGTGSRLVTWPGGGGFQFAGGATPTLSTGAWISDFFEFMYFSGSQWKEISRSMAVP